MRRCVLVDGREFVAGRRTGIGRFLEGLLRAASEARTHWRMVVAMEKSCALPSALKGRVDELYVPHGVEWFWPRLARGCDLFLSPYPKLPWRALPCPAIHTVHDVLYLTHPAYRGHRLRVMAGRMRLKRALRQASLTWFDSAASLEACRELAPAPCARVRFPAIDACFTPGKPDPGAGAMPEAPYFLFVGNGLPHKNLRVLLAAMDQVDARLAVVGLRDAILPRGVRQRVQCLHDVGDAHLRELYRGAIALLQPSTAEGFGYPPLEAMACGTPAVVSDIPVLRETTGGAARTCPPEDAGAWAAAMRAMLNSEERQAWAERGLAWADRWRAPGGWRGHLEDMARVMEGR